MISSQSITVMVGNKMRTLDKSSANYEALREELRKPDHDVDTISDLVDITRFIIRATFGEVEVSDDKIRWRGRPVSNALVEKILTALRQGDDITALSLFLDKVMQNPSETAQNELYLWLEAGNAPICPDGDFLAFKRVRHDYRDCHSGRFDNSVGQVVQMDRASVDPDRHRTCSAGLHFCQHGYLSSFGGGRTVIVKINPADVVAIPADYRNQKGRTWRYEVVGEVDNDHTQTANHFDRVIDDRYTSVEGELDDEGDEEDNEVNLDPDRLQVVNVDVEMVNRAIAAQPPALPVAPVPAPATDEPKIRTFTNKAGVSFTPAQLQAALADASGSVRGAAKALGIAKSTLQDWVKQLNS